MNNYPTPEGVIPQPSAHRLRAVGEWLQRNGETAIGLRIEP
jgi:alpha-L-fucosidase